MHCKSVPSKKNGREGLDLESKMALRKSNTNFRFENSIQKNKTTCSDLPLHPEIYQFSTNVTKMSFYYELQSMQFVQLGSSTIALKSQVQRPGCYF